MKNKLIIIFFLCNQLDSKIWIKPENYNYSYVYGSGIFSTETQLSKYCPKFIASTGEIITCDNGVETIQDNVSACNFAEINLNNNGYNYNKSKILKKLIFLLPTFLYLKNKVKNPYINLSAFFAGSLLYLEELNCTLSYLLDKKSNFTVDKDVKQFDKSILNHRLNLFNLNIGQDKDIDIYKTRFEEHNKKQLTNKQNKVILYGFSRGAATVFNYYALYNPENVAAIICEGIFDSILNIEKYGNVLNKLQIRFLKNVKITQFKPDGICPFRAIENIKKDKPIALITSLIDEVVPFQCTLNIYKKLIKNGFTKVHILILKNSYHAMYPLGNEKEEYQNFIHAFYKAYDLPYIEEYAINGEDLFKKSQPNLKDDGSV